MTELTYATVCSGIECMSVACRGLPMRPVFFSEIEPFPCAVLTHGIMYVEAIKIALTNLESALASLDALGYAVSARISYGRIMSVGVNPKRD